MRFEEPSSVDDSERIDSFYGESSHRTDSSRDERELYGEPRHEVESEYDEQTLYGEPQHEPRDEGRELPDVELLFARMRVESTPGPIVLPPRTESSTARTESSAARTTER